MIKKFIIFLNKKFHIETIKEVEKQIIIEKPVIKWIMPNEIIDGNVYVEGNLVIRGSLVVKGEVVVYNQN